MAEYLDRKAFKEEYLCCGYLPEMSEEEFDAFQAADVSPVVRCKNCRYNFRNSGHDKDGCPITDNDIWMGDNGDVIKISHVRNGRWIHTDLAAHWLGKDECSECTYHEKDRRDLSHFNYCPNCGAKMDLKGE